MRFRHRLIRLKKKNFIKSIFFSVNLYLRIGKFFSFSTLVFICLFAWALMPFFVSGNLLQAKTKEVNYSFPMQIPEGFQYITHDFHGISKRYVYLIARPNPASKWDYDKYVDYRAILKDGRQVVLPNLWSSFTEIFVSYSGKNFFIINLMDGGWTIYDSENFTDFTWYKPIVRSSGQSLFISYKSKYRTEILIREIK